MALPKKLRWVPEKNHLRGPEWKPRRCKRCKLMFVPDGKNPANAKRAKFCCKNCKNGYHRHGGMDLDRMREYLTKGIVKALLADESFLEALADKLRASSLGGMVRELAREEIQASARDSKIRGMDWDESRVVTDLDLETQLEKAAKLQGQGKPV